MLDRRRALQILGLPEDAEESEIRSVYRALRAHVEQRARAAGGDSADVRGDELRDLERLWRALSTLPAPAGRPGATSAAVGPPGAGASRGAKVPRWLLGWAIVASLVAAGLGLYLLQGERWAGPWVLAGGGAGGSGGQGDGGYAIEGEETADSDEDGGGGEVEDAGPRARLVAESDVEGATLAVRLRGAAGDEAGNPVVAEGAADESVYWLAPGDYEVAVRHPDCADVWKQELRVEGGEDLKLRPELCKQTGWMVVRSNVAEDELHIDGRSVGATGERKHPVSVGEHEVRVAKPGYEAWEGIVQVEPGQVLAIRPRLAAAAKTRRPKAPQAPAPQQRAQAQREDRQDREERQRREEDEAFESWHEDARRWLLSRYDYDRSGALDSREEIEAVPCDSWLGLEQSYDQSRLGLPLTRFYGFDGDGWRSGALGVSDEARDLAYRRMQSCGLR